MSLFLKDNDLIDVVAPGFKAKLELVNQSGLAFQELGLKLRYPDNLYGLHYLCSNSVEVRADHLKSAIDAEDSKLIWGLRGGYGSIHLLPIMDGWSFGPQQKLFVGYSDVTSLIIYFVQRWGWKAIHGPLVDGMTEKKVPAPIREKTMSILRGKLDEVVYPLNSVGRPNGEVNSEEIEGQVLGGNLLVSQSTLGTPYQLVGKNRILFFEEVSERAYRIDRALYQMNQSGVFDGVRAVVFGEFIDCYEPNGENLVGAVIEDFASQVNFPVFRDLPVGHGLKQNPLPMGYMGRITPEGWLIVSTKE